MHSKTKDRSNADNILENAWSIRPCNFYEEEYRDCTSIKGRFHQYFVNGDTIDCSQWKRDFDNCVRYEKSNGSDVQAGKTIIESETNRRDLRMKAHYENTVWKKRSSPPKDWSKPLPEWLIERNKDSYLGAKQDEIDGRVATTKESKSYCIIM